MRSTTMGIRRAPRVRNQLVELSSTSVVARQRRASPAAAAVATTTASTTQMPGRCTLFVGGLPESFTSPTLKALFAPHGEVAEAEVLLDDERHSRCFGFVVMANEHAARTAKDQLDGTSVAGATQGRSIKVRWALDTATLRVSDLGPGVIQSQLQEVRVRASPHATTAPFATLHHRPTSFLRMRNPCRPSSSLATS